MKGLHRVVIPKRLLYLGLIILLWQPGIMAEASDGRIRITLGSSQESGSNISGVEFHIFQVGWIRGATTGPEFYPEYEIDGYPQTAEEMAAVVRVLEEKGKTAPMLTGTTDRKGVVEFEGLEDGVYFITAIKENPYGLIMPSVVQLPYYEVTDAQKADPIYQVEIEPKAETYPEDPEGVDKSSNQNNPAVKTASTNGVKTGDTSKSGIYLCMVISSLFIAAGVVMKRRGGIIYGKKKI